MTVTATENYNVLNDDELRLAAERLLLRCGVPSDLKGYASLIDAILLYSTGTCRKFCDIYRIVGEHNNVKPKSVLRDITYAISQAFDLPARLSDMVGTNIAPSDIHSGLIVSYLGKFVKYPSLVAGDEKTDSDDEK